MALEQRRVFEQCWLYTGHASEIPQPGDFRSRRVAGRPVILVRGSDGVIRVLLNTCTHRGAQVCRESCGNAKTFQCFYHAWTFNNQGELIGVPGEDAYSAAFDRQELGLASPAIGSTASRRSAGSTSARILAASSLLIDMRGPRSECVRSPG